MPEPQAVRAILPIDTLRTKLTMAGQSDAEIQASIKAALRSGQNPAL